MFVSIGAGQKHNAAREVAREMSDKMKRKEKKEVIIYYSSIIETTYNGQAITETADYSENIWRYCRN